MMPDDRRAISNLLWSIPIGAVGGVMAGEAVGLGFIIGDALLSGWKSAFQIDTSYLTQFPNTFDAVGLVIGIVTFPIACMTLIRASNIWIAGAAGVIATVVVGLAAAIVYAVADERYASYGPVMIGLAIATLALPVVAMFLACAWAVRRERRLAATKATE